MEIYKKSVSEISKDFSVNIETGLSDTEAEKRLIKYGANKLSEKADKPFS